MIGILFNFKLRNILGHISESIKIASFGFQYLINLFGTDKIFLTGRGSIDDSQEVYLKRSEDDEYIGIIYKNDDSSYTFTMSILDFDL